MSQNVPLDFREFLESELAGLQDRIVPRAQHLEKELHVLQLRLDLVKERLSTADKLEFESAWQQSSDAAQAKHEQLPKRMSIFGNGRSTGMSLVGHSRASLMIAQNLAVQGFETTLAKRVSHIDANQTPRMSLLKANQTPRMSLLNMDANQKLKKSHREANQKPTSRMSLNIQSNELGTGVRSKNGSILSTRSLLSSHSENKEAELHDSVDTASAASIECLGEQLSVLPGTAGHVQYEPPAVLQEDSDESEPDTDKLDKISANNGIAGGKQKVSFDNPGSVRSSEETSSATEACDVLGDRALSYREEVSEAATDISREEETFEVLPEWQKKTKATSPSRKSFAGALRRTQALTRLFDSEDEDTKSEMEPRKSGGFHRKKSDVLQTPTKVRCMLMPNSLTRFVWDLIGIFLILYDAIWLPLQFFSPPESAFSRMMVWCTRLFWSLELGVNFRTGFMTSHGELEQRSWQVVKRYLKSWFLIDMIVVSADWLEFFVANSAGGGAGAGRFVKTFRIARTLRMIRLMRLMKMPGILANLKDELSNKVRSEKMFLVGGVMRTFCGVIVFIHITGCFWFLVGDSDSENSWIIQHEIGDMPLAYRYMTCFHWSLTNLSGTMEVGPHNLGERVYAVCVGFVAWVISASAVSTITTAMTRDSMCTIQDSMESVKLRKYLLEHKVSRKLMARILRNASYATAEQTKSVKEENLALLHLVSEPLRIELHFEVRSPILEAHPFFFGYKETNPAAMRRVCHTAVTQVCLSPGDILFSEGETPTTPVMYFVVTGTLKYWQSNFRPRPMRTKDWSCEACLWTTWVHQGYLRSSTECNIVALGTKTFMDCDAQCAIADEDGQNHSVKYANEFVDEINRCIRDEGNLTDLESDDVDVYLCCEEVFQEVFEEKASKKISSFVRGNLGRSASRIAGFAGRGKSFQSIKTGVSEFVIGKVGTLKQQATITSVQSTGSHDTSQTGGSKNGGPTFSMLADRESRISEEDEDEISKQMTGKTTGSRDCK